MQCSVQYCIRFFVLFIYAADNKVHGANMGPTWVLSAPDGPHVCPMNLAIRGILHAAIASLGLGWYTRNASDITVNHCLKSASTSSQCTSINHGHYLHQNNINFFRNLRSIEMYVYYALSSVCLRYNLFFPLCFIIWHFSASKHIDIQILIPEM